MHNVWTSGQYNFYRVIFGIYLIIHFGYLMPWCCELFSNTGMIPHGPDSPLLYCFPNILAFADGPIFVMSFIGFACLSAICFLCGYKDKWAAFYMWYVLACLLGRNPLIANPSLPYVGWMLLAHLFIPKTHKSLIDLKIAWVMPTHVYLASWIVLAISYSYSGYTKLLSSGWVEGKIIL